MDKVEVPGEDPSLQTKLLCHGSAMMENFTPLKQVCDHVCGFHFYSGEINRQVIAHHYCSVLNEDFRQCVVYDSDKADAKLIGVEYIISEKLFKTLPEDEKKFWHSHVYEVKSGLLMAPNIPNMIEIQAMKALITTYGKTYHFWQIDRGDKLPLGEPKLMMAFTEDSQVDWNLVKKRDEELNVSTEDTRKYRESLEKPTIQEGADQWNTTGKATVFKVDEVQMNK
jgi:hypothetical protein